jgi:hypothetical protein
MRANQPTSPQARSAPSAGSKPAAVRVIITDAGIERVTAFRAARAALIGARLEQLTPEDQHALAAALPALDHFIAESAPSTHKN